MVALKICALTSWLQCYYVERNLLEFESMHVTATISIFQNFTSKNEQYDDGQKKRLKHIEHLTEINKLRNTASCWLYSENILAMHGPRNVKK